MKIDWKSVARIGTKVVGLIVPGVAMIEQIAQQLGALSGQNKQDAVVGLVKSTLAAAEGLTEKELANDADVEAATRSVIDAVVALHKVIAYKAGRIGIK